MTEQPSVEAQLATISVKLDLLLAGKDDHEVRLRALEQFKWILMGAATAAGGAAGALMDRVIS